MASHLIVTVMCMVVAIMVSYLGFFGPPHFNTREPHAFKVAFNRQPREEPSPLTGNPVIITSHQKSIRIALIGTVICALCVGLLIIVENSRSHWDILLYLALGVIFYLIARLWGLYTNKLLVYQNCLVWQNRYIREIYYYVDLDAIVLQNYLKRDPPNYAYELIQNGRVAKKLWGHHYTRLEGLERAFHSRNPLVKSIISAKLQNYRE